MGGESIAGDKLKEAGTAHWASPSSGTNETGFTSLPAGKRDYPGTFVDIGNWCYWWSTNRTITTSASTMYLYYSWSSANNTDFYKSSGFSVRCIKD